jgi:hypothetical protein
MVPLHEKSIRIPKVQILPIRQIIKSMHELHIICLLNARSSQPIFLLVLAHQMEAQEDDDEDEQSVAAEMCAEGDEVAGGIPFEEDLGTWKEGGLVFAIV